ncbi:MAG: hypothetical protein PVH29_14420 [Candidatus Zixiibacteriota bacterium]|jgi:hypothetical protein
MRSTLRYVVVTALLLGAAAAWGIGELNITNPADGAAVKPGQVVRITWRNMTTNPVEVWLKWEDRRKSLGEKSNETDGMMMWRVPEDAAGAYTILVEEAGGLGSSSTVELTVGGTAPALPEVYATPNPFDVSSGRPILTFAGAPIGSSGKIFDMEGREVVSLSGDPLQWDGRNDRGDMVAGGTYMFVVETEGGERHTGKIAVIK